MYLRHSELLTQHQSNPRVPIASLHVIRESMNLRLPTSAPSWALLVSQDNPQASTEVKNEKTKTKTLFTINFPNNEHILYVLKFTITQGVLSHFMESYINLNMSLTFSIGRHNHPFLELLNPSCNYLFPGHMIFWSRTNCQCSNSVVPSSLSPHFQIRK